MKTKSNSEITARYTLLALAGAGAIHLLLNLSASGEITPAAKPAKSEATIARGKYLLEYGGCNDCHTPKKMGARGPEDDLSRLLSGHPGDTKLPPPPAIANTPWNASTAGLTAWSGPWGISYSANLTPDIDTGIGIWTEEMFVNAMRFGKHMGSGRDILPPMPWQYVAKLNDDDLKSIYAYLRTVPAVSNRVPNPVPPGSVSGRFD